METPLDYSFAEFIHKNCIGNSSNLNEDFLRSIVGKPKSTGSKIKSQPLRLSSPGKIQGPCSPVRDGHHPRNLSWLMVFPLPGTPSPYLPPTLMALASHFLQGVSCAMKPLPTALSKVLGPSLCPARVPHTQASTAPLITSLCAPTA